MFIDRTMNNLTVVIFTKWNIATVVKMNELQLQTTIWMN